MMMFLSSKRREKDGFQIIGAADAVYPIRKGFYGSKRFIQGIRLHLELSSLRGIQRFSRTGPPRAAIYCQKRQVYCHRFGAITLEIQKILDKIGFQSIYLGSFR